MLFHSLIGVKAQEHPVNLLISGFQPLAFFLRLGSVYQIPALHPAAQSLIKCVGIFESLCRQFLNVLQNKVIQIPCLDLMAGAGVLAQPVVGLADIGTLSSMSCFAIRIQPQPSSAMS